MTKQNYLAKLEQQLLLNQVNNSYTILNKVSKEIDESLASGLSIEQTIEKIGSVEEVCSRYHSNSNSSKTYDNDEFIYENKQFDDNNFKESSRDFINDFSNQFRKSGITKPENLKKILYIVIAFLIIGIIINMFGFLLFTPYGMHGFKSFPMFYTGSRITKILMLLAVLYILMANKKK